MWNFKSCVSLIPLSCFLLHTGQMVDGPQYGVSPQPWDIPVRLPPVFIDMVELVRVPHSSVVKVRSCLISDTTCIWCYFTVTSRKVNMRVCFRCVTSAAALEELAASAATVEDRWEAHYNQLKLTTGLLWYSTTGHGTVWSLSVQQMSRRWEEWLRKWTLEVRLQQVEAWSLTFLLCCVETMLKLPRTRIQTACESQPYGEHSLYFLSWERP